MQQSECSSIQQSRRSHTHSISHVTHATVTASGRHKPRQPHRPSHLRTPTRVRGQPATSHTSHQLPTNHQPPTSHTTHQPLTTSHIPATAPTSHSLPATYQPQQGSHQPLTSLAYDTNKNIFCYSSSSFTRSTGGLLGTQAWRPPSGVPAAPARILALTTCQHKHGQVLCGDG